MLVNRSNAQPFLMITQEEAVARILSHMRPLPARSVELADALDCFAARDISAALSLPLFDNSSMDGYAVVATSCKVGARLRLVGEQPAGVDRELSINPGEAIRILTGAPMPAGADAVVMQEETRIDGEHVVLTEEVEPGENVRRRGGDVAEGQKLIEAGDQIGPQMLALLAAQGIGSLEVGGRVRAAIISTGDELIPPGATLRPGLIYDSNSVLLQALLTESNVSVASIARCADDAQAIEAAIRAATACDVMIITGGVSVGARDLVKPALTAIGATLDLWRVAVKPGKPFLFGHAGRCAIFGLPGNLVSAFVTFLLFVRPALLRLKGAKEAALGLSEIPARLGAAVANDSERAHYMRGRLSSGTFSIAGCQESHAVFGLSRSNALLRVRPGEQIAAGAEVTALIWD